MIEKQDSMSEELIDYLSKNLDKMISNSMVSILNRTSKFRVCRKKMSFEIEMSESSVTIPFYGYKNVHYWNVVLDKNNKILDYDGGILDGYGFHFVDTLRDKILELELESATIDLSAVFYIKGEAETVEVTGRGTDTPSALDDAVDSLREEIILAQSNALNDRDGGYNKR